MKRQIKTPDEDSILKLQIKTPDEDSRWKPHLQRNIETWNVGITQSKVILLVVSKFVLCLSVVVINS